jgi:hypothetical protein
MSVSAGQILSAARLNAQFSSFQAAIDLRSPGFFKAKSGDTSRASTTTYADDPHLTFQGVANTTYILLIRGIYQAPVTPQIKFQFVFPSGTYTGGDWDYDPGTDEWAANPATGSTSQSSPASLVAGLAGHATSNFPFRFQARLSLSSTGGTCALQWAQNVSNASATIVRAGSWLLAQQVN